MDALTPFIRAETQHVSTASKSSAPARRRRKAVVAGSVGAGVVVLLGGAYGVGYAVAGQYLPPNTTIEGVAVGGASPADAERMLTEALASAAAGELTIASGEHQITRGADDLGLKLDPAASVAQAMTGKSFNPVDIWESLFGGRGHDAVITTDDALLDAAIGEVAQLVDVAPVNAELVIEEGAPVVKEASDGHTVDVEATRRAVVEAYLRSASVEAVVSDATADITTDEAATAKDQFATPALAAPVTLLAGDKSVEITPEMIGAALTFVPADGVLAPSLDGAALTEKAKPALDALGLQQPKDARIVLSDGKPTVVPAEDGVGVSADELARVVSETMLTTGERRAEVAITEAKASFTTEQAEALGVKEVIGEFTTKFPATAYRVNNIGKSAGLINNVLLKPGETFSMNQTLGPRTTARGWMAGGAIDGGRVVERMGGGISQTTTTLFNAVFFAGLEDIYHKPHSLYFSRYPMGREATLDYVSVDMKFRNDSSHGVLIQAFTNNPKVGGQGTITVRIWGTKTYDVKASNPVQSNFRSPGATIQDNSAVCSPQSGMSGFTVNFNREFYQNGSLVKTEPFKWTYNTLTPVKCTNPAARPDRVVR